MAAQLGARPTAQFPLITEHPGDNRATDDRALYVLQRPRPGRRLAAVRAMGPRPGTPPFTLVQSAAAAEHRRAGRRTLPAVVRKPVGGPASQQGRPVHPAGRRQCRRNNPCEPIPGKGRRMTLTPQKPPTRPSRPPTSPPTSPTPAAPAGKTTTRRDQSAGNPRWQASPRCSLRYCRRSRSTQRRSTSTSYAWPWRRSAYRRADPATTAPDGTRVPAVRGVRLHDLRHTFATMQSVGGCAFHAGVKVVRTQQLRSDAEHLRRLHQGRRHGCTEFRYGRLQRYRPTWWTWSGERATQRRCGT